MASRRCFSQTVKSDCFSKQNRNRFERITMSFSWFIGDCKNAEKFKATPHNYRLTPLLRVCLHLFCQSSQISSAEESLLPFQFVLSDEKSGGATAQQSLCGIALRLLLRFYLYSPKIDLLGFVQCINFVIYWFLTNSGILVNNEQRKIYTLCCI